MSQLTFLVVKKTAEGSTDPECIRWDETTAWLEVIRRMANPRKHRVYDGDTLAVQWYDEQGEYIGTQYAEDGEVEQ